MKTQLGGLALFSYVFSYYYLVLFIKPINHTPLVKQNSTSDYLNLGSWTALRKSR